VKEILPFGRLTTHETRIEEIDFGPRLPAVRLILSCLVFGILAFAFVNQKWADFSLVGRSLFGDLAETIGIGLLLLLSFGFIASFLLLQFRLKFTEAGIQRVTLFPPWFIPWDSVRAARVGSFKGYLALELWVSKRRWICIPLLEYRKGDRLLAEIRRKLPVEVQVSDTQLSQMRNG
jgi:hypothetical protein